MPARRVWSSLQVNCHSTCWRSPNDSEFMNFKQPWYPLAFIERTTESHYNDKKVRDLFINQLPGEGLDALVVG
jgi:hypothetical protein